MTSALHPLEVGGAQEERCASKGQDCPQGWFRRGEDAKLQPSPHNLPTRHLAFPQGSPATV
jgi:hypothetical protein